MTPWTSGNNAFWATEGNAIADQNTWISIPTLLLAFAVWMVWGAVVVQLPATGFKYSTDELF